MAVWGWPELSSARDLDNRRLWGPAWMHGFARDYKPAVPYEPEPAPEWEPEGDAYVAARLVGALLDHAYREPETRRAVVAAMAVGVDAVVRLATT